MRKLLFAATAAVALAAAVPASAQVWVGAEPDGAGVQIGPFGFGVGPRYDRWRDPYWRDYAYDPDCRVVRERIRTPSGRLIIRTHRVCD